MPYMAYSSRARHGSARRGQSFGGNRNKKRTNSKGNKQYINPSKFVQAAQLVEEVVYEPTHKFIDFDMLPLIHENIAAKGYVVPSPIQDQTIPHGLAGRDVIGLANTGTGKTAAFLLPILQQLLTRDAKAIIIAPTRELAQQIEAEFASFAKGSGLFGALLGHFVLDPQFGIAHITTIASFVGAFVVAALCCIALRATASHMVATHR